MEYVVKDGVHTMVLRQNMCESTRKLRDTYAITPGAPFVRREFGFYCLERWEKHGMPKEADLNQIFDFDPPGKYELTGLGWCTPAFFPEFEDKVIEQRGEHEVVQDSAGRHVLFLRAGVLVLCQSILTIQ